MQAQATVEIPRRTPYRKQQSWFIIVMKVGDKKITRFPVSIIVGQNGDFRVVDHIGSVELYFCVGGAIVSIRRDGTDGSQGVEQGHYLVEKLSDKSVLASKK